MPRVVTMGTFDIPHIGHQKFLDKASQWGDLTIGINTDSFVKEFKGKAPLYTQFERQSFIKSLGYHQVFFNPSRGLDFIKRFGADTVVIGSDWLVRGGYLEQIGMTQDDMVRLNISIVFVPFTPDVSSTDIKRRILADMETD